MKNNLIFCCAPWCLKNEMRVLAVQLPDDHIRKEKEIVLGDNRWIFYTDINQNPHQILGMKVSSWRQCPNCGISDTVRAYLDSHMEDVVDLTKEQMREYREGRK
jgi:CO dehydrogenase/acetyl-CoA synthase delta subunit